MDLSHHTPSIVGGGIIHVPVLKAKKPLSYVLTMIIVEMLPFRDIMRLKVSREWNQFIIDALNVRPSIQVREILRIFLRNISELIEERQNSESHQLVQEQYNPFINGIHAMLNNMPEPSQLKDRLKALSMLELGGMQGIDQQINVFPFHPLNTVEIPLKLFPISIGDFVFQARFEYLNQMWEKMKKFVVPLPPGTKNPLLLTFVQNCVRHRIQGFAHEAQREIHEREVWIESELEFVILNNGYEGAISWIVEQINIRENQFEWIEKIIDNLLSKVSTYEKGVKVIIGIKNPKFRQYAIQAFVNNALPELGRERMLSIFQNRLEDLGEVYEALFNYYIHMANPDIEANQRVRISNIRLATDIIDHLPENSKQRAYYTVSHGYINEGCYRLAEVYINRVSNERARRELISYLPVPPAAAPLRGQSASTVCVIS